MSRASLFLALTKPRILALVLLSGLPALAIAGGGWPAPGLALATLLGTALTAAAANAFNSYLEREPDALMERTRDRPLPSGALPPTQALVFGFALGALGVGLLWRVSGPTAAGLPTGFQLIGRPFDESTLFRLGGALERAAPWWRDVPPGTD